MKRDALEYIKDLYEIELNNELREGEIKTELLTKCSNFLIEKGCLAINESIINNYEINKMEDNITETLYYTKLDNNLSITVSIYYNKDKLKTETNIIVIKDEPNDEVLHYQYGNKLELEDTEDNVLFNLLGLIHQSTNIYLKLIGG